MVEVIGIVGASRSGSTLLEGLLADSLGGVAVGELHHYWDRGVRGRWSCGCGVPVPDCRYWSRVSELFEQRTSVALMDLEPRVRAFERDRRAIPGALRGGRVPRDVSAFANLLGSLYTAIADAGDASIVIDSSKSPAWFWTMHAAPPRGVTLSTVHLTRDVRAFVHATSTPKQRQDAGVPNQYMGTLTRRRAVTAWARANATAELVRGRSADHVRLAYEDLVRDSEGALHRLRRDLGLVSSGHSSLNHSVSGNPVRTTGRRTIRPDFRWAEAMSAWEKAALHLAVWPVQRRYGYRWRR